MSQNLKVESVRITDLTALNRAIEKCRERGHKVSILENTIAKMWSGKEFKADYVIRVEGKRFDIGLKKGTDKEGNVYYTLVFDDWDGEIFKTFGKPIEGISHGMGHTKQTGKQYTPEELTLSNVAQLVTDYNTEAIHNMVSMENYQIDSEQTERELLTITVNV